MKLKALARGDTRWCIHSDEDDEAHVARLEYLGSQKWVAEFSVVESRGSDEERHVRKTFTAPDLDAAVAEVQKIIESHEVDKTDRPARKEDEEFIPKPMKENFRLYLRDTLRNMSTISTIFDCRAEILTEYSQAIGTLIGAHAKSHKDMLEAVEVMRKSVLTAAEASREASESKGGIGKILKKLAEAAMASRGAHAKPASAKQTSSSDGLPDDMPEEVKAVIRKLVGEGGSNISIVEVPVSSLDDLIDDKMSGPSDGADKPKH